MVIRERQMGIFRQYMLRQFEERMVAHLGTAYPRQAAGLGPAGLRALVRRGVEQALAYHLETEQTAQRYLEYLLIYGPEFGSSSDTAWAGAILNIEGMPGWLKMDRIDERHRRALQAPADAAPLLG